MPTLSGERKTMKKAFLGNLNTYRQLLIGDGLKQETEMHAVVLLRKT